MLIDRLTDPDNPQALPVSLVHEDRLQILLYLLKINGFPASGIRMDILLQSSSTSYARPQNGQLFAIGIREGGVSEMFSLHKKIKVAIERDHDGDIQAQVKSAVDRLIKSSLGGTVKSVFWEETYPELIKEKDLLLEIKSAGSISKSDMRGLITIGESWTLSRATPSVLHTRKSPRL